MEGINDTLRESAAGERKREQEKRRWAGDGLRKGGEKGGELQG